MKNEWLSRLGPVLLIPAGLFLFQNCSGGLHAMQDPEASTFQAAADCIDSEADACGFTKNVVAQAGKSVSPERVGGYQVQALAINGRDGSGYLQNADFIVTTSAMPRLNSSSGFRRYFSVHSAELEQVLAYTSVDRLRRWFRSHGYFPAANGAVKIIVDSSFNGWAPAPKEIHLERAEGALPAALDASVVMQLYAQANISLASGGLSHAPAGAKTVACANARGVSAPRGCCASALGCGSALVNGAADYITALQFAETSTVVGDGWKNDPSGLKICGLTRDPAAHATLTATQAVQACGSRGAQAPVLGLIYASVWWQARAQAADKAAFDVFFLRHLSLLRDDDDFKTITAKIQSVATTAAETTFAQTVTSALTARGH